MKRRGRGERRRGCERKSRKEEGNWRNATGNCPSLLLRVHFEYILGAFIVVNEVSFSSLSSKWYCDDLSLSIDRVSTIPMALTCINMLIAANRHGTKMNGVTSFTTVNAPLFFFLDGEEIQWKPDRSTLH